MGNRFFLKTNAYILIYTKKDQRLQDVITVKERIHAASMYLYSASLDSLKTLYLIKIIFQLLYSKDKVQRYFRLILNLNDCKQKY